MGCCTIPSFISQSFATSQLLAISSCSAITRDISTSLRYCHIISTPHSSHCNPVSLAYTLVISKDLTWQLYIGPKLIDAKKCLFVFLICLPL